MAASVCMDCFAVSACSSVTLGEVKPCRTLKLALVFAIVQTALFVTGIGIGTLLVGFVSKMARIIAFLLLAGVGVNMIRESLSKEQETINLNGLRNVILGAVATSIDASIVGTSLSMNLPSSRVIVADTSAIFLFTMLSVMVGMRVGCAVGCRYGRPAELVGGAVLIALAVLEVV